MRKALSLLLLITAIAPAAMATDLRGSEVVIPIAGRWPGAFGSQWRTDVVITNTAKSAMPPERVFVVMSGDGAMTQPVELTIAPYESVTLKDIVSKTFGRETGGGLIRIVSQSQTAKITARARIYNTASTTGEYGQTIHAAPVGKLAREALLPGLSGVGVNRTNVGIANPASVKAGVWISLYDSTGDFRGAYSTEVAPRDVLRINDVFSQFQAGPLDNAMIKITATHGVYPYASVVRSDTGDADFVIGTALEIDAGSPVITPSCASPAPLNFAVIPATGWIVIFHTGTDAKAVTAQLAARYGFTPLYVYEHALQAFHAELTQAQIAALRCEPAVRVIEQNATVPLP